MTQDTWIGTEARAAVVASLYEHGFLGYAPTTTIPEIAEAHEIEPLVVHQVLQTERGKERRERHQVQELGPGPAAAPGSRDREQIVALVKKWDGEGGLGRAVAHDMIRQLAWPELLALVPEACTHEWVGSPEEGYLACFKCKALKEVE